VASNVGLTSIWGAMMAWGLLKDIWLRRHAVIHKDIATRRHTESSFKGGSWRHTCSMHGRRIRGVCRSVRLAVVVVHLLNLTLVHLVLLLQQHLRGSHVFWLPLAIPVAIQVFHVAIAM
jgi:ABC-type sugar transport system permease subunit